MKARRIFASALAVAGFAAGMPTSTDASNSTLSIKNSNSTLNNNDTLIIKPTNSTNSTSNSNSSSNTTKYSESERKKMHQELEDPVRGFVWIDDPEAGNITLNSSVFRTASRIPNNSWKDKSLFVTDTLEDYPLEKPPKPELQCLESNHWPAFPRMSWQFKGYCEEEYGQCFLRALRKRGAIVHNWQCWKRDDGWWQADYTHIHAYLAVIPVMDEALAEIIGYEPHCE